MVGCSRAFLNTGEGSKKKANPPKEIQTLIDNHIDAFNTQNIELFHGVFGDTAIIIDGIAPYRWLNPNAPANWLADVEKWRKDLGVTHEHMSYKMGRDAAFWGLRRSDYGAVHSDGSDIRCGNPPLD